MLGVEILNHIFMVSGCCPVSTPEYASCGWRRKLTWLATDHGYFNDIAVLSRLFRQPLEKLSSSQTTQKRGRTQTGQDSVVTLGCGSETGR